MITAKDYRNKTMKFWEKVVVINIIELKANGGWTIPMGTRMKITDKWRGFAVKPIDKSIKGIMRVHPNHLTIVHYGENK